MQKILMKNPIVIFLCLVLVMLFLKSSKQINYVSHSKEPKIGDRVQNNNPSCKHFQSVGTVTSIKTLKGDKGKTITYKVENDGSTYCKGQLLDKTMDQLAPLH
jgi:exopolysaccharide biosynthesis protein